MLSVKTILYPTDFSENSEDAFRMACALARDYGAQLVIAHVNPPPVAMYTGEGVVPPIAEPDPAPLWERLRQIRPDDQFVKVEHFLLEGDEASEILRVARDVRADMIVMGTHGRTGLKRLLLGSVAEQVMRRAECPVITVKAPSGGTAKSEQAAPGEPVGAGMFGVWP